jgi:hypothetical protein
VLAVQQQAMGEVLKEYPLLEQTMRSEKRLKVNSLRTQVESLFQQ